MTAGEESEDTGERDGARYTAVFTGRLDLRQPGDYPYLRVGDDGSSMGLREGRPPYAMLGRGVAFEDLSESARREILRLYREMWDL